MMQSYPKPWQSYQPQLDLLITRGMTVTDQAKALEYLERIGYYRLSGYWFAFRERSELCCPLNQQGKKLSKTKVTRLPLDNFKAGTTFHNAVDLYVFDKKLRLLTLDALERIEIALRVDISHGLGRHEKFAYLRPEHFHESFSTQLDSKTGLTKHNVWLGKHAALINRSNEDFIRHNKEKYGLPLAVWVACEVWDFGTLSTLYAGMTEADQDAISQKYRISNGRIFASWLRSLNYLRNVCAHHSRLWNRNIVDQPKLPPVEQAPALSAFHDDAQRRARPFILLCITQHLMKVINPSSSWGGRMKTLLGEGFPNLAHLDLSLDGMGIDQDWQNRDW
ncbi:Abi family protein [Pseudomonas frederiksbergensis]|uniref:Abi family protein n=1 Tax=Pseudomonas frederiksbergensis TaxID=104087 RepID=UPI000F4965C4|nr:Abi family protein [Pseudomonas frederiksbergensis]RON44392.1 abortive phage resistance protein [Pseudomonas frederiksbergensis]